MKYKIIYADPPRSYKDKALSWKRWAWCKYDVQDDLYIYGLWDYIKSISEDDCILFIWATFPKIQEALNTIKARWFEYKTNWFTRVKKSKNWNEFIWMWRRTRANAEVCLIATRWKPKRINAGIRQIVISNVREHSRKPDEARDRIVQLCWDLPRIELFARTQTPWRDVWGNETNKF